MLPFRDVPRSSINTPVDGTRMDGMALNITLVTYDKNVDFGITACRRSAPNVHA